MAMRKAKDLARKVFGTKKKKPVPLTNLPPGERPSTTRQDEIEELEEQIDGVRTQELKKRTIHTIIKNELAGFRPLLKEFQDAQPSKTDQWTVPQVINVFNTGKITMKFLATVKDLLSSAKHLDEFVKSNGFPILIQLPEIHNYKDKSDALKLSIVDLFCTCLRASHAVVTQLVENPAMLNTIVSWTVSELTEMRSLVYLLCATLPFLPADDALSFDAYNVVVNAFDNYQYKCKEKFRFEHLLENLRHETDEAALFAVSALVNNLVSLPAALADRVALRLEFKGHDVEQLMRRVLDTVERQEIEDIVQFWKRDGLNDEEEYEDALEEIIAMKFDKPKDYFAAVEDRVQSVGPIRQSYEEVIRRLLVMPTDQRRGFQKWLLIERVLKQLSSSLQEIHPLDTDKLLLPMSEALPTIDPKKMKEEKALNEAEMRKVANKIRDAQESMVFLKEKEARARRDAERKIEVSTNEKKVAEDEKRDLAKKLASLNNDQKKWAMQTLEKLQSERVMVRHCEASLGDKDREFTKIKQSRDEEKFFITSKLKTEIQEEKKQAIKRIKEEFKQQISQLRTTLEEQHKKTIEDMKAEHTKQMAQFREQHAVDNVEKVAKLKRDYENIIQTEKDEAILELEDLEDKLLENQSRLNENKSKLVELQQLLKALRQKLNNQEKMFQSSLETNEDQLTALKASTEDLNQLLEAQAKIAEESKKKVAEIQVQIDVETATLEQKSAAFQKKNEILQGERKEIDKLKQHTEEQRKKMKDINKVIDELKKTIEDKDKESRKIQRLINKVVEDASNYTAGESSPPPPPPPLMGGGPPPPPPPPPPGGGPPPPPPPPPPPGGGPPPPPPPPGGGPPPPPPPGGRGGPPPPPGPRTKNEGPKPVVKMKPFHWTKLTNQQVDTTVFKNLKPGEVQLDFRELEKMYCVKKVETTKEKPKAVQKVSHVNPKTVQSVGIFLRQLMGSKDIKKIMDSYGQSNIFELVKDSIYSLDNTVLEVDRINGLLQGVPEPAEITAIKEWLQASPENTMNNLNEVDQFFFAVSDISGYLQRLKSWRYTLKFNAENSDLLAEIEKFKEGFNAILNSKHLLRVLEVVLAVGNFLNYGGRSGGTVGFDISILPKLADTKANGGGTLLDFVITTLETQFPEALAWTTEMAILREYKTSSWEKIDLGVKELKAQTVLVKNLSRQVEISGSHDKFGEIISRIEQCDANFEKTKAAADAMQKRWEEVAEKFAKDAVGMKPEAFFAEIAEAVDSFEKALKEKKQKLVAQEKQKNKEKVKEEMRRLQLKNLQTEAKLKSTIQKKKTVGSLNTISISEKGTLTGGDGDDKDVAVLVDSMLDTMTGGGGGGISASEGTMSAREREEQRKAREERKRQIAERKKELQRSISVNSSI